MLGVKERKHLLDLWLDHLGRAGPHSDREKPATCSGLWPPEMPCSAGRRLGGTVAGILQPAGMPTCCPPVLSSNRALQNVQLPQIALSVRSPLLLVTGHRQTEPEGAPEQWGGAFECDLGRLIAEGGLDSSSFVLRGRGLVS